MNKLILALSILLFISMTACKKDKDPTDVIEEEGTKNTLTIINNSGKPVYVYDWDMGLDPAVAVSPVTGGNPLSSTEAEKGGTLLLTMQKASKPHVARRIYISEKELNNSLHQQIKPTTPDPYNFHADATVHYSFIEYNYDPASHVSSNSYTIDLSYIDEYSYPVTLKFSNVGTYAGCVEGHEYGLTSISKVKEELKSISPPAQRAEYAWDALIWPEVVKCEWNSSSYPVGMVRIIGPNKVWSENPGSTITQPWVPDSYLSFIQSLPNQGTQLFDSVSNYYGWENWKYAHNPSPSTTGYVKALQSSANKDKNGKYGFFCYPNDNPEGEFTFVPDTVKCTITVYSLSD